MVILIKVLEIRTSVLGKDLWIMVVWITALRIKFYAIMVLWIMVLWIMILWIRVLWIMDPLCHGSIGSARSLMKVCEYDLCEQDFYVD